MRYIIHYDLAAIVLSILLLRQFKTYRTIATRQSRVFFAMFITLFVATVFDTISVITASYVGIVPVWADYLINITYLLAINAMEVLYLQYISCMVGAADNLRTRSKIMITAPYLVCAALILTSPITKLVIYYDDRTYEHGPLFTLLYVVSFTYMLVGLVWTVRNRAKLVRGQVSAVVFFTISLLAAFGIQFVYPRALLSCFAASLAMILVHNTLENPEHYMDDRFDIYNDTAFREYIGSLNIKDKAYKILGIRIDGIDSVNEVLGLEAGDLIIKNLLDYLGERAGSLFIFRSTGLRFTIVGEYTKPEWNGLIDDIRSRFVEPFYIDRAPFQLEPALCVIDYPGAARNLDDIESVLKFALSRNSGHEPGEVIYANSDILEKGRRESKILMKVRSAMNNDGFDVFLQPIYSNSKKRFTCAEALVRLYDQEMGMISPAEFIPIAEKHGYIQGMGEIVLRKVCNFFKENDLKQMGVEYIHVNLSTLECMRDDLEDSLTAIIDSTGLPRECIHFEITETAAVASKERLAKHMNHMIDKGIKFAMDDYGSGYSNVSTIIDYPFSSIKLDKSLIWPAVSSGLARTVLDYNIQLIDNLGISIVAEGVETDEQLQMVNVMGVEYIQGFYYSKPLPGGDYIDFIKEHNN